MTSINQVRLCVTFTNGQTKDLAISKELSASFQGLGLRCDSKQPPRQHGVNSPKAVAANPQPKRRKRSRGDRIHSVEDLRGLSLQDKWDTYKEVKRHSYGGSSVHDEWKTEIVDGVLTTSLCSTEL